jgi:hypothetical protein
MRDTNYMAPVSVPLNQRSTGTGGRLLGRIYEAIQNRLLEGEYRRYKAVRGSHSGRN